VLLVMKESLHNILKHARASEVSVQLEIAGPSLELRIHDNGCGFDASPGSRRGNGLGNMEQRIRDLGGDYSLRSAPGEGTKIEIKVPLR
jgi:signal transduction histidine kinase